MEILAARLSFRAAAPVAHRWVLPSLGGARVWGLLRVPGLRPLTGVEKVVMVVGGAWLAVKVYQSGYPMAGLRFLVRQVPGWGSLKVKCGFRPVLQTEVETGIHSRNNVLESVRAGSTENPMPQPACQVAIGVLEGDRFLAHGCALRLGDYLVMPSHVYALKKDVCAMGHRQHSKWLPLSEREFVELDTDILAVKCSPGELSTLLVKQAALCHEIPEGGHYASVVGSAGKGTTGTLRTDPTVFGRVVYSGTTVGGYSGAGYMVGTTLAGIHQSGGVVNGGFSASYLWAVLSQIDQRKDEASEDWLASSFKSKRRIKIDPKWNDLDEIRVQVNGRYAVVERSSMAKAFGSDWRDLLNTQYELVLKPDATYESGEARDSGTPGASSSTATTQGVLSVDQPSLVAQFKKLTPKKRREFLKKCGLQKQLTRTQSSETLDGRNSVA